MSGSAIHGFAVHDDVKMHNLDLTAFTDLSSGQGVNVLALAHQIRVEQPHRAGCFKVSRLSEHRSRIVSECRQLQPF